MSRGARLKKFKNHCFRCIAAFFDVRAVANVFIFLPLAFKDGLYNQGRLKLHFFLALNLTFNNIETLVLNN